MWRNLYKYIDVYVKYIFLFENEHSSTNEDFLISEHPADLQMPGLLETREHIEEMQSIPCIIRSRICVNFRWSRNLVAFDRTHYYGHIAGIKKLAYKTHRDVIEKNTNIQFKIINVPISFALYHKIVNLSPSYKDFNNSEICTILKYYTRFSKEIMIQLVKIICEYLLHNEEILQEIQKYEDHPSSYQCTSTIMSLLISIFSVKETITPFKRHVRSYITFVLPDEDCIKMKFYGQSPSNSNHCLNMDQDGFALAFLFNKIEIEYEWLVNNGNVLDTIFSNNMIYSSYIVIINDSTEIFDNVRRINTLKKISSIISTSKFLTGQNISQLILKFKNLYGDTDISCLTDINASETALYTHLLQDFIESLPECAKIEVNIDKHSVIKYFDSCPRNLTRISCDRIECDNDIKIPDHIEKFDVKKCVLGTNKTLTLSKNCKRVKIMDMRGKLIIPGLMKCDMGLNTMCEISKLEYNRDEAEKQRKLELYGAKIRTTVTIGENIEKIIFNDVTVTPESIVVLNDKCRDLYITNSEGRFDLRLYIGMVQCFDKKMEMKISIVKDRFYDFFGITVTNWCLTQTVKLPNIYGLVNMHCISMAKNTELILNKACKKLLISNCEVIINCHELEYLENLGIWFFMNEESNIKLVGLRRVNHISFFGICCDVNLIIALLASIENIQRVEFDHSFILMNMQFLNEYYGSLMTFITSKGCFEDNPDLLSKFLAIKDKEPNVFVVEMFNNIVNYILRDFLDHKVINTVSTLEFEHIAIDSDNCRLLRKLKRLKILRIHTKHITGEVLYNLPPNLELLDITNLFIENINQTEKYVIKPSIIIQPYKRLKILVIDVEFLYNVRTLSMLMPSLEVIEVQYSESITTNPLIPWKKIKINELFIQCGNFELGHRNAFRPNEDKMVHFLKQLKFYIEFESLQCVAFVLSDKYTFFDPMTLKIIE